MSLLAPRDLVPDRKKRRSPFLLLAVLSVIILLAWGWVTLWYRFVAFPYTVSDNHMYPALKKGSQVTLEYTDGAGIKAGDIVLYEYPAGSDRHYLGRAAALAGQSISLNDRRVFVDGQAVNSVRYFVANVSMPVDVASRDNMPLKKIADGEVFMLSDNLKDGFDSRYTGPISLSSIRARLVK